MDNANIKLGDLIGSLKRAYKAKRWESVYNNLIENKLGLEEISLSTLLNAQSTETFFYVSVNENNIRVLITQYLHTTGNEDNNGIFYCKCNLEMGIFFNKPLRNDSAKFDTNYNTKEFPLRITETTKFYRIDSDTFHYIAEKKFDL